MLGNDDVKIKGTGTKARYVIEAVHYRRNILFCHSIESILNSIISVLTLFFQNLFRLREVLTALCRLLDDGMTTLHR